MGKRASSSFLPEWETRILRKMWMENDLEGKTIYSLVTHGGSGFGSAIQDTEKYTKAGVSSETLAVYDDEVTEALPEVLAWVKRIGAVE